MKKFIKALEFCKHITDGTHDSPQYLKDGFSLITSKYIMNNKITLKDAPFISKQDFDKINERSKVEVDDILFSMIGTVGEVALVRENNNFAIKNMGLFRCKNLMDSLYLYYYFQSSLAKEYELKLLAGSTQQYLTLSALKEFPILCVEPQIQQHIVNSINCEVKYAC